MKAGGKDGGLTVTISVMQIVVCAAWAMGLWLIRRNPTPLLGLKAPAPQPLPAITKADVISLLPLTFCYAFAHTAGVVTLTAGSPAFGQIVKVASARPTMPQRHQSHHHRLLHRVRPSVRDTYALHSALTSPTPLLSVGTEDALSSRIPSSCTRAGSVA